MCTADRVSLSSPVSPQNSGSTLRSGRTRPLNARLLSVRLVHLLGLVSLMFLLGGASFRKFAFEEGAVSSESHTACDDGESLQVPSLDNVRASGTMSVLAASPMKNEPIHEGLRADSLRESAPLTPAPAIIPDASSWSTDTDREPSRVNVYIYDNPALDHSKLINCYRRINNGVPPWQDEREELAQNMGEIWLHRALLIHPWRVIDPEKADVFFVPMYPILSFHLRGSTGMNTCSGSTHEDRMTDAVEFLEEKSLYFKRFGGADHVIVCSWWNCREAIAPVHRMILRRAVVAMQEGINWWTNWGCQGRNITVPYTASSEITSSRMFGGLSVDERNVTFFFAGTARRRPERRNLQVVEKLYPNSIIDVGRSPVRWSENATSYAQHMTRSRFCFCPRGDTATSRRVLDAISAGCIPVMTTEEAAAQPYLGTGLNYSEFAVIYPAGTFGSSRSVARLARDLASRSNEELAPLHKGLKHAMESLVFGVTTGPNLDDMYPFVETASYFLREVKRLSDTMWDCPALAPDPDEYTPIQERGITPHAAPPRTVEKFPPSDGARTQWLLDSETLVVKERSLLFCAPPNTGSQQFRMLARRMKAVEQWAIPSRRSVMFGPAVASELPLLNISDTSLMSDIYKENHSGWIKIGVVRDPVTRLLSLYLDLVQEALHLRHQRSADDLGKRDLWWSPINDHEVVVSSHGIPSFSQVLHALEGKISKAPPAFMPISSMCGMRQSPFDTLIPFESIQKTSARVLKSLPGGVWDDYGASGWGLDGTSSFMEFDYDDVRRNDFFDENMNPDGAAKGGEQFEPSKREAPHRARDLFEEGSCAWTQYYTHEDLLMKARSIYAADYDLYQWYSVSTWVDRFRLCMKPI